MLRANAWQLDYKQFGFDSGVHFPPNNDVADI